jgi:hypothetical protein
MTGFASTNSLLKFQREGENMKISRWWHLVSLTVFLVVGIALPIIIIHQAISLFSTSEFFFVPGSVELKLTPGKYVI